MTDWIDFTVQYPAGAGTELDEQQIRQLLAGAKSWDERYRRLLQLTKRRGTISSPKAEITAACQTKKNAPSIWRCVME